MAEMKHSDPEYASARNGADNASGLNNPSGMAGAPGVGSAFGGAFNGSDSQAAPPDGNTTRGGSTHGTAISSTPSQPEPAEVMQAAWDQVMDVLQAELSGPTYNNYLRHIKPVALRSDSFTLSVPSDFVRDWLVRRFAQRIEETLEQFLGRPMTLAFQTAPGTSRPVEAEEVAPEAEPELPEVRAAELQEQEERAQTPVNAPLNFPRGPASSTQSAQSNKPATWPAWKTFPVRRSTANTLSKTLSWGAATMSAMRRRGRWPMHRPRDNTTRCLSMAASAWAKRT
jgi:hypothetical protein